MHGFWRDQPRTHYPIDPTDLDGESLFNKQINQIGDAYLLDDNSSEILTSIWVLAKTEVIKWIFKGEVVAGSSMSNIFNPDVRAEDIDIYFHSKEDAELFCQVNNLSMKVGPFEICGEAHNNGVRINLIWGIAYNTPADLIAGFDIRACAIAWAPHSEVSSMTRTIAGDLYYVKGALEDTMKKRLVFQVGARKVSVQRLLKYIKKGFAIDKFQRVIFAELIKNGKHSNDLEMTTGYGEKK